MQYTFFILLMSKSPASFQISICKLQNKQNKSPSSYMKCTPFDVLAIMHDCFSQYYNIYFAGSFKKITYLIYSLNRVEQVYCHCVQIQ